MTTNKALIEEIRLTEELARRARESLLQRHYDARYDWQDQFIASTDDFDACLLMAGNQVGKTRTGCQIDAFHLTGNYPKDWKGHKYEHAPLIWVLGYSGVKIRDILQRKLFGRLKNQELEGGYVSKDLIIDYTSMSSVSGAAFEVRVKHKSGGTSVCQFWSYSQGQHALMGDVVDWFHIDEEPEDAEIYPQVTTRLLNGDKGRGGRGILTFTPENGKTELVTRFMDEPEDGMFSMRVEWSQCPHMDRDKQKKFLAKFPKWQRDMRSKGIPLMGTGLIFDTDVETLKIDPFRPPEYWFVINGIDFGWDHPQAIVQLVEDRDNDIIYVTNAWKASKTQPYEAWHIVKPWADKIPTAWPHDGNQTRQSVGQQDAMQQKTMYGETGFWMLGEMATWPDGGNGVGAGLVELNDRMATGRIKIFSNLFETFTEMREYHTKTTKNGGVEIVKIKDDIISAIRYAYMMRRYAIRIMDINPQIQHDSAYGEIKRPSSYA